MRTSPAHVPKRASRRRETGTHFSGSCFSMGQNGPISGRAKMPLHGNLRVALLATALAVGLPATGVDAKDKVKVVFIGPLTGGVAANGIGGRNSAELAVKLRDGDPKAKYEYELEVLDDECKPNIAVQTATKAGADRNVIAAVAHYCSAAAIATVDVFHRLGLPMSVWGAVLPDITYRNKYPEIHRVN